eukprot:gene11991-14006_t
MQRQCPFLAINSEIFININIDGRAGTKKEKVTKVTDDIVDIASLKQPVYEKREDSILIKGFRLFSGLIWIIIITTILWLVAPFALFIIDPIMRKMGIRVYYSPLEFVMRSWSRVLCWIWNITVHVEGTEHPLKVDNTPAVLMYSHASNLDPIILMGYTPLPARFIFKKELLIFVPFVFLIGYLVGHIPIDRKKHKSAIESINYSAKIIRERNACVVIAPEGTRSLDGKLQEFKKGPFHMALKTEAMVVPATIFGNHELWPVKNVLPSSGHVHLRYLPPFKVNANDEMDTLLTSTRNMMLKSLCNPPKDFKPFPEPILITHAAIWLGFVSCVFFSIYTYLF